MNAKLPLLAMVMALLIGVHLRSAESRLIDIDKVARGRFVGVLFYGRLRAENDTAAATTTAAPEERSPAVRLGAVRRKSRPVWHLAAEETTNATTGYSVESDSGEAYNASEAIATAAGEGDANATNASVAGDLLQSITMAQPDIESALLESNATQSENATVDNGLSDADNFSEPGPGPIEKSSFNFDNLWTDSNNSKNVLNDTNDTLGSQLDASVESANASAEEDTAQADSATTEADFMLDASTMPPFYEDSAEFDIVSTTEQVLHMAVSSQYNAIDDEQLASNSTAHPVGMVENDTAVGATTTDTAEELDEATTMQPGAVESQRKGRRTWGSDEDERMDGGTDPPSSTEQTEESTTAGSDDARQQSTEAEYVAGAYSRPPPPKRAVRHWRCAPAAGGFRCATGVKYSGMDKFCGGVKDMIPREWVCDQWPDCVGGEDEEEGCDEVEDEADF